MLYEVITKYPYTEGDDNIRKIFVITSYSIHYTKLYDIMAYMELVMIHQVKNFKIIIKMYHLE